MSIAKDKVVTLEYVLKDAAGEVLEETEADDPFTYLHGRGQLVPGLEKRLEGMTPGQSADVVVPPDEGHGMPDPEGRFPVPRDAFPPDQELNEGDLLLGETEEGDAVPVRVVKVMGDQVLVDANHPLAGQTLHYSVKIIEVRDATPEEIAHEHVHGPGGHDDEDDEEEDEDDGDSRPRGGNLIIT